MSPDGPRIENVSAQVVVETALNEMRISYPEKYKEYRFKKEKDIVHSFFVSLVIFPFVFISFIYSSYNPIFEIEYGFFAIISFFFSFILSFFLFTKFGSARKFVLDFSENQIRQRKRMRGMVNSVHRRISEIEARGIGDIIIAYSGATIINRSIVVKSFNNLKDSEPELADALKVLTGFVENSKSLEAAEVLESLTEAINKKDRKPSQVRAFWNDLVVILPGVTTLVTAAAAITKLFS